MTRERLAGRPEGEDEIITKLTEEDIARIDALARERGISREEMLCAVIGSGVEVLDGPRSGVRGPHEKSGA